MMTNALLENRINEKLPFHFSSRHPQFEPKVVGNAGNQASSLAAVHTRCQATERPGTPMGDQGRPSGD